MTQNVVNHSLNPRTVRLAEAFFDMEDDLNVTFRQSRLVKIAMDSIFDEVCALCRIAEEHGVLPSVYQLRQLKRDLSALDDAIIAVDDGAERMEQRYYEATA